MVFYFNWTRSKWCLGERLTCIAFSRNVERPPFVLREPLKPIDEKFVGVSCCEYPKYMKRLRRKLLGRKRKKEKRDLFSCHQQFEDQTRYSSKKNQPQLVNQGKANSPLQSIDTSDENHGFKFFLFLKNIRG